MFAGCQTRFTAEKYAEQVVPLQEVVTVNGVDQVITKSCITASGGWCWTARSPLWATEAVKGLDIGCKGQSVWLRTDTYKRDLSENAVAMTKTIFDGSTNLVAAIGKAYAMIASGGSADAVSAVSQKVYSYFKEKGGDETKSTVTCENGKCTVTDGSVCIECDADGNCTDCTVL